MVSQVETADEETLVAILFADVVGSTHLYEAMGDNRARETVQKCLGIMKQATEQYGGAVIKTVGDEVMSTFPSADDALNAGSQMQQRITNDPRLGSDGAPVSIRIGCHFGPVVLDDRDIYGAAVNTANRMTSQAKAGQIIITAVTTEHLGSEWRSFVRQIDVATVKGQAGQFGVYEVLWQPDEATRMLPSIDLTGQKPDTSGCLRLKFGNREIVLDEDAKSGITIGRADENDIVIKGNLISRVHARINLAKNKFLLVDESTNGTFVQRDDGDELYVRRDSTELSGVGIISFGRVAARGTPLTVEYSCEN